MATLNPFDLLGDDDTEDPSLLIAAQQQKVSVAAKKALAAPAAQQQSKPAAKLPSKPLPPAQAVRESKTEATRGGGRSGGRGYVRGRGGGGGGGGGRGYDRDSANAENAFGNKEVSSGQGGASENAESGKFAERRGGYSGSRVPYRGGRLADFGNGELADEERPRRAFDRRSGTGRGNEFKHEGSGRGNWGTDSDELAESTEIVAEGEKNPNADKPPLGQVDTADGGKETPATESEEKEPENKEMTLEEYEKVLEEKRKALQALKTEGRKVDAKAFESMQQLANKKASEDVFIKLGSDKDKKKDSSEKEERAKKSVSINEFLKPADGERYYSSGGRGRGRGRGGFRGYGGVNALSNMEAPSIEDPGHFPTLSH